VDEKLWKRVCAEITTEIYLLAENWKYLLAGLIFQVLYFEYCWIIGLLIAHKSISIWLKLCQKTIFVIWRMLAAFHEMLESFGPVVEFLSDMFAWIHFWG
jgi:hypothetical protein